MTLVCVCVQSHSLADLQILFECHDTPCFAVRGGLQLALMLFLECQSRLRTVFLPRCASTFSRSAGRFVTIAWASCSCSTASMSHSSCSGISRGSLVLVFLAGFTHPGCCRCPALLNHRWPFLFRVCFPRCAVHHVGCCPCLTACSCGGGWLGLLLSPLHADAQMVLVFASIVKSGATSGFQRAAASSRKKLVVNPFEQTMQKMWFSMVACPPRKHVASVSSWATSCARVSTHARFFLQFLRPLPSAV